MKHLILLSLIAISGIALNSCADGNAAPTIEKEKITFYEVPLICGAAPEIGCGSRLKPLFLDTEKEPQIKESWSNRQGTVVAFVWNEPLPNEKEREQIINPIFKKNTIDAQLISNQSTIDDLTVSLNGKDKWYKGMDVDLLSIEEAGIIAESLTKFAKDEGLLTDQEAALIKKDIEDYFKKELTQVRTYDNLKSEETQEKWSKDGYQIYVSHIGKERADKISEFYEKYSNGEINEKMKGKSCCDKKGKKKDCCKKL